MIEISSLERSNRKSLSIIVKSDGKVVIKAPLRLPMAEIEKFVKAKEDWINKRIQKLRQNEDEFAEVINYQKMMIYGQIYPVYRSKQAKDLIIVDNKVLLPEKWSQDKLFGKITRWLKKEAENYLLKRLMQISENINLFPTEISTCGSRGKWGSCSSKGQIKLNFRCVLLPRGLIDYIIIHELAHLEELNHSARFWLLVEKFLPKYKDYRKELKKYGFILKLF